MRFQMLAFLVILACLYITEAHGSFDDCCLKYSSEVKPRVKRMVVKYRIQETKGGCNIPAIVFTFKRGKRLCGDPKHQWVKDLKERVDQKMLRITKKHQGPKRG